MRPRPTPISPRIVGGPYREPGEQREYESTTRDRRPYRREYEPELPSGPLRPDIVRSAALVASIFVLATGLLVRFVTLPDDHSPGVHLVDLGTPPALHWAEPAIGSGASSFVMNSSSGFTTADASMKLGPSSLYFDGSDYKVWFPSGGKRFSFRKNGVERCYIDADGKTGGAEPKACKPYVR